MRQASDDPPPNKGVDDLFIDGVVKLKKVEQNENGSDDLLHDGDQVRLNILERGLDLGLDLIFDSSRMGSQVAV